ncbi:SulP family inorganic anion transporter [Mycolicibacterium mucogenicum]|uniref:SulP family inorganic anion transporter n=1 Tax=Mycolicibacterium mucogenicum TaxID=56689 RepID=UPI000769E834|nr:SulP family inorganic anion transporter [Mycolicibacterium mucogenicum]
MTALAADRITRLLPSRADYVGLGHSWRRDVLAGVTVGVVALPLALAFGISSGVGAAAGLVTAVVAGLVAAVFGGSHVQVSGPTGAMTVVLAPIVAQYGLGSVAAVTILAGVIVVVAGVTGVGRAVTFIPWPVIEGFTLGIAAIIFLQQVPAAFGQAAPAGRSPLVAAGVVVSHIDTGAARPALLVTALVAVLMIVLPRLHPAVPASLVAVVAATALVAGAGLSAMRMVAATMSPTGPYDPNRELVGQGLASVASGVFGGMPATGAIARTAVNVRSGARTRVAAIVHSLVLLAVVYLISGLVGTIPLAALSAVLMVTAFRMISPHTVTRIMRSTRSDAVTFLLTATVTVCFDLIQAVEIGIATTALFALRALARRSSVTREELPGPYLPGDERIALLRLDGAMFFGAAERISTAITDGNHPETSVVIIRLSKLGMLDATGAHTLTQIVEDLEARGITVIIKGVRPEHRDLLAGVGIIDSLRHENHLIENLDDAIAHARSHTTRSASKTHPGKGNPI